MIKQVHALTNMDDMLQGLKITNKTNNIILDSAWIAGVHYDEEYFKDDKYNEGEEENKN